MSKRIKIFDTTLRDGEQAPGCSMNLDEKIEIARQLERLKVDVIEAGFAISSPVDFKSIEVISQVVKECTVASLARAMPKDIDAAYDAVKGAVSPRIHTFLATSPVHMQYKLKMTPEQVIQRVGDMVAYAKKLCSDIEFSAEDAMRSEPEFLAKVVQTAINAGATVVNIPDTVGFTTADEMYEMIKYLMDNVINIHRAEISTHCHNDLGMAVANSLAAIRAGATQVECTVNGLGERAGNAALEEIVMALKTRKAFYNAESNIDTTQIYRTSKLVYNIIGQVAPINKSIVGANAFAHESGIHQHGMLAEKTTYEIMTPESVGLTTNKMILGKHSGRHAFESRLMDLGYRISSNELDHYFEQFKNLCDRKKAIHDNDLEALMNNRIQSNGTFKLEGFDVHTGSSSTSTCVIRLKKDDVVLEEVSIGDGPVDAAYNAIDKVTGEQNHTLDDYSIHSSSEGKDALGEVVVKLKAGNKIITGRGLSTDIIEASILAYVNGINKIIGMQ